MCIIILHSNGEIQGMVKDVPSETPLSEVLRKWCNKIGVPQVSRHRYYAKVIPTDGVISFNG